MPDATRADVMRLVYQRLANPTFRRCLTATAPDGTRPIIVALRDDPMYDLAVRVRRAGGAANVVVPAHNGFIVLEMVVDSFDSPMDPGAERLAPNCTVGLFIARLHVDATTANYVLADANDASHAPRQGSDASHPRGGRARVVALGD